MSEQNLVSSYIPWWNFHFTNLQYCTSSSSCTSAGQSSFGAFYSSNSPSINPNTDGAPDITLSTPFKVTIANNYYLLKDQSASLTVTLGNSGSIQGSAVPDDPYCSSNSCPVSLSLSNVESLANVSVSISPSSGTPTFSWTLTVTAGIKGACGSIKGHVIGLYSAIPNQKTSIAFLITILGCNGGGGCVGTGTPILTNHGYVSVQSLIVGTTKIAVYNVLTHVISYSTLRWLNETTNAVDLVSFNNGALVTTAVDQPLYVRNGTWIGEIRDPWNIYVGEQLYNPSTETWVPITSVTILTTPGVVFDLSVGGKNGFIANGLVAFSKLAA